MPAAQLKRLKASLREAGVTGPQKSKKQKKRDANDVAQKERRASRNTALQGIREKFNPFEVKTSSRGPKHEVTTATKARSTIIGRPGIQKGIGEEVRRKKLLVEMQRRGKAGGILDRRFGENDPTMTPEERALERFVKEKQRGGRKNGLFDLEAEDEDEEEGLTHQGQRISFSETAKDDFVDTVDGDSTVDDPDEQSARRAEKRRRLLDQVDDASKNDGQDDAPSRPKTKQEIMQEVIAKSKLHKYERQKAKDEDEDLRDELDAEMKDIYALLKGQKPHINGSMGPVMNPDRAALLSGVDREQLDKEYDQRLRQLAQDARSKPTSRTKTEEEIAEEQARKLREMEQRRLRRMRGEEEESSEGTPNPEAAEAEPDNDPVDEDDNFGLGEGISARTIPYNMDVEEEDDFMLDDDLIASGSELDVASEDESGGEASNSESSIDDQDDTDDEAEFIEDLLTTADSGRKDLDQQLHGKPNAAAKSLESGLAFMYTCPATHEEFLSATKGISGLELVTVIQRIRALYHPKLDSQNKTKLGIFVAVLVQHLVYSGNQPDLPSFSVIEQLIRHIHSLAKTFPLETANAFRTHVNDIGTKRPLAPTPGDLFLFTAIGQIFSTSDQFHQVATPAMLCMAWYLGQSTSRTLGDLTTGAYICTQFLQYQRLSKRYIPEVLTYLLASIGRLAPKEVAGNISPIPEREFNSDVRITGAPTNSRTIRFWDVKYDGEPNSPEGEVIKHALLDNFVQLAGEAAELWIGKSAYVEMFDPVSKLLSHLMSNPCANKLAPLSKSPLKSVQTKVARLLAQARLDRRPLALHNYRPLPIRMSIPKFEEGFQPDKHFDPDRERAELSKLKAEHKRERKGALRELRKDANFIARENLRQKKAADAEYEKKYKRLVAEIQGEEAHEAKEYQREKKLRQGKR